MFTAFILGLFLFLLAITASALKKIDFMQGRNLTAEGGILFDHYTEMCCDGTIHSLANLARTQYCCGSKVVETNSQICCWRGVDGPSIQPRTHGASTGCCKDKVYDKSKEVCCRKSSNTAPIPAWVTASDASFYRCCTNVAFDKRDSLCCNGRIQTRWSAYSDCCAAEQFDRRTHLCCRGTVVDRKGLESQGACCGKKLYDVGTQLCCSDDNVVPIEKGLTSCCGSKGYNKILELCCANKIIPRKWYSPTHKCCGANAFDTSKELCCAGTIRKKRSFRSACCGTDVYEMDLQMCCDKTLSKRKNMYMRCCRSENYDNRREVCCGGQVMKHGKDTKVNCCAKDILSHIHHSIECTYRGDDFPPDDENESSSVQVESIY